MTPVPIILEYSEGPLPAPEDESHLHFQKAILIAESQLNLMFSSL